jgi:hypothetical protein
LKDLSTGCSRGSAQIPACTSTTTLRMVSALRRLGTRRSIRQDEVDALPRQQLFVELYQILRHRRRVGAGYSIKSVECLYRPGRTTEVLTGAPKGLGGDPGLIILQCPMVTFGTGWDCLRWVGIRSTRSEGPFRIRRRDADGCPDQNALGVVPCRANANGAVLLPWRKWNLSVGQNL